MIIIMEKVLAVNPKMQIIKIKDGEYLVKEGTMSNYSFELKDEKNDHLLDTIIEDSGLFPQDESSLVDSGCLKIL